MAANGSPRALFETDEGRTSFVIRLPVHDGTRAASGAAQEATGEVAGAVMRLLRVLDGSMSRLQFQQALALKHEDHFRQAYLVPALTAGLIEMTPRSGKQRYRLTATGLKQRQRVD